MSTAVVVLAVCFALLLALLAALLVATRWAVWVKVVMTAAVVGSFYLNYLGLERLLGWPASEPLPERFPAQREQHSRTRYGLRRSRHHSPVGDVARRCASRRSRPRAYVMAYNRDLHYKLQQARKRQGEGIPQIRPPAGGAGR